LPGDIRQNKPVSGHTLPPHHHFFTLKVNLTFAIRTEKRLFLGTHHPATLDFKGVIFQNWL